MITEFPITTTPNCFPTGITSGLDGNLWFTEELGKIGKVNLAVPMSDFSIQTLIIGKPWFYEQGRFHLGAGSTGINPLTDPFTFRFGTASIVIAPGSFHRLGSSNNFWFAGNVNGVSVYVVIQAQAHDATSYNFAISGWGLDLASQAEPMNVGLQIGINTGSTTFKATVFP